MEFYYCDSLLQRPLAVLLQLIAMRRHELSTSLIICGQ